MLPLRRELLCVSCGVEQVKLLYKWRYVMKHFVPEKLNISH